MKKLIILFLLATFTLTGCAMDTSLETKSESNVKVAEDKVVSNKKQDDFNTQEFGGVITLELPSECIIDGGAGSGYVVCPTDDNPTPTPEMVVSTDGVTVNIKKWEGFDTDFYQETISTLKVKTPLSRSITINIE